MRFPHIAISLAALLTPSATQELLWQQVGVSGQLQLGGPSVFVGDVNSDGFDDLVSVAGNLVSFSTELHVRSGRDGSLLRVDLPLPNHAVIALASAGDMDGDGVRDYVFSSTVVVAPFIPYISLIEVRSGATGGAIWQVTAPSPDRLGDSLAGDLDLDGDGRPDVVASAPGENNNKGAIHAYDHLGRPLYTVPDYAQTLASLGGDFDGRHR